MKRFLGDPPRRTQGGGAQTGNAFPKIAPGGNGTGVWRQWGGCNREHETHQHNGTTRSIDGWVGREGSTTGGAQFVWIKERGGDAGNRRSVVSEELVEREKKGKAKKGGKEKYLCRESLNEKLETLTELNEVLPFNYLNL